MFNTITRQTVRPRGRWVSVIGVAALQVAVVLAIFVSTLYVTGTLPQPADMMAFVVTAPPPPPPPPPPEVKPPEAKPQAGPVPEAPKIVEPPPVAAPIEAPKEITAETGREAEVWKDPGAEKTITGGVGSVTGVDTAPPEPPAAPVRVGGSVSAPKLTKRVEPEYPSAAQAAKIQGTVILEATVDEKGSVDAVKVLRSNPLLDGAALAAVKQWKYQPLLLNGKATPFILTVTVSFGFS